jgi:predicted dehydrogenase
MESIKVAVIGLGYFGALEVDILANLPGVEISALVSRSEERTQELAQRYDISNTYQDTEAMLHSQKLDAVFVVTEDERHYAPTMAALQAGVDVFLEKPISHDLHEARQMIDTAAQLDRKLMIGHVLRHDPSYAAVKTRISSGEMGRMTAVYGRRNMARMLRDQYQPHLFYTTGIHDIDIILWFYEGIKPVEVFMKTVDAFGEGEDVFWGMITMEDGSLGIVETNWALPLATPWRGHIVLEAIGTQATALIEAPGNGLSFWTDEKVDVPDTAYWPSLHGVTVGALQYEISYFIRCLIENKPITLPYPEDAYESLRVAEALLLSSRQGTPVRL